MEVDEAPRSRGRFNLDRAAQYHINEGMEVGIPNEPVSSVRGLEAPPIRPLMDVALPRALPRAAVRRAGARRVSSNYTRGCS